MRESQEPEDETANLAPKPDPEVIPFTDDEIDEMLAPLVWRFPPLSDS